MHYVTPGTAATEMLLMMFHLWYTYIKAFCCFVYTFLVWNTHPYSIRVVTNTLYSFSVNVKYYTKHCITKHSDIIRSTEETCQRKFEIGVWVPSRMRCCWCIFSDQHNNNSGYLNVMSGQ